MTPDSAPMHPTAAAQNRQHLLPTVVLHVGIFPPPVDGGIAAYLEGMLTSPLAQRFQITRFNMRVGEFYRRHRWARFGMGLRLLWRFLRCLRASRVNIVHVHTSGGLGFWERSMFCTLVAWQRRPYVLHVHGGDFDQFLQRMPSWQRLFAASVFRKASAVIVLSHAWKPFFAEWVEPECLHVIPNAIHVEAFSPATHAHTEQPLRILFVGMMSERKGLDELCTALTRLVRSGVNHFQVDLLGGDEILGSGTHYRILFRQAGLDPWVRFHGLKSGREKIEFYQRADVFVLPSRSESFGIVNLEAMASGLPVVSTRTGAIPEYIVSEEYGLLVDPGDSEGLMQALRRLIEDPALRSRLGAAAREQVKRYDWHEVVHDLENVYHDILCRE